MRALGIRPAVSLAASAVIGLIVLDVAFVFWAHGPIGRERRLSLRAALLDASTLLVGGDEVEPVLSSVAARHRVVLSLRGPEGESWSSSPVRLDGLDGRLGVTVRTLGWEHVAVAFHHAPPWQLLVASYPIAGIAQRIGELQQALLPLLVAAVLFIVLVGLLFLRRVVVRPIARMTHLVGRSDRDALFRLGNESPDELAGLSRAIIAMTQTIEEDRQQIAEQLGDIKRSKLELEATQHQLIRAERLAVVGQLAAGVAHEIGNPLAVLSGYVEVLAQGDLATDERQDALARMGRELQRIHATLRALLDFSRAPEGHDELGDVAAALGHVEQLVRPHKAMRSVTLEICLPSAELPLVPVSPDRLTQVLLNLLLNAADALGGKGQVRVSVARRVDAVEVVVEDSGPGVPEALRQRIFDPFYTTKPPGSGTGLGLAVCERMVASAGGDILVGSSSFGGAAFRITLPAL